MTIKQTLKNTFQKRESDSHFSFIYIRKHFIKVSFYYQVLFSKHYFSLFKYLHITLYEPSGCFFNSSNDNIMCVCKGKKEKKQGLSLYYPPMQFWNSFIDSGNCRDILYIIGKSSLFLSRPILSLLAQIRFRLNVFVAGVHFSEFEHIQ